MGAAQLDPSPQHPPSLAKLFTSLVRSPMAYVTYVSISVERVGGGWCWRGGKKGRRPVMVHCRRCGLLWRTDLQPDDDVHQRRPCPRCLRGCKVWFNVVGGLLLSPPLLPPEAPPASSTPSPGEPSMFPPVKGHHNGPPLAGRLRGNGCPRHPDCFSCPFPDCTWAAPDRWQYKGGAPRRRSKGAKELDG